MDRPKATLISAFVIAILFAPTASAQALAAKLQVVSGNGQMTCPGCSFKTFVSFYPMAVKVTDANGNPIVGKTINWTLVSAYGNVPSFDSVSYSDSTGVAVSHLYQGWTGGSAQNPFLQSVISATVDGISINFTETQALTDTTFGRQIVFSRLDAPINGAVLSGPAGSTGTVPVRIHIDGNGTPVPNVSVRILNPDLTGQPSASCATAPGADPGSVLTDANGDAVCYPVFGSVAGNGPVSVLVGGLDPANYSYAVSTPERPLNSAVAFDQYLNVPVAVTPVTPGHVSVVSGNNQNIDPGKTSNPLVAQVTDLTGNVTVGNTGVAWTVSPAGSATLSSAQTSTDSHGQTQITATLSPAASGQVSIRAALAGNSGIAAVFTLSTNIQIASLTKVSGDQQTTRSGQPFGLPLVVQVNGTNGQAVSNQLVGFVVTGNATLSASSMLSDGAGQAKVTVTAGAAPGAVTVTAFVGTFSAPAFTLTVIPPGPSLSTTSFYNAGGGARLAALSPCGLVTVIATGLAPNVLGMVFNSNSFGPWATTLATDTVAVNNAAAPISSVGNVNGVEQLTFQVPCDAAPAASVPITISVGGGTGTVNFPVQAATPGIYETVMSDGTRRAVAIRPDGTFVTLQNPARPGDVIRVFVTGLGPVAPSMVSGSLPFVGADSLVLGQVIVGVNNAGARVVTARVSPNLIGVYEIDFQVPSDAPSGNDVVLSVAVNAPGDSQTRFSNGSKLPIKQ